jgi:arylsulfatase A-like enzyme
VPGSLCAVEPGLPARAALLTGRNHHAVGFGSSGELSSGFRGYTAFVPEDSADEASFK